MKFTKVRPQQEIRLRKWPPARVAQLKLFVSHLETAVNTALAAQVKQTVKRKFSEFVPIIPEQDIRGEVEYREIRIEFDPPKGLRRFLFYEYQISESSNFFQFESFTSPEPFYVFTGLEDAAEYFIRIRVVTTDGDVGPFSSTFNGTTIEAKAQGVRQELELQYTLSWIDFTAQPFVDFPEQFPEGGFQDIYIVNINSLGGKAYYSIEYEATISSGASTTQNIDFADVEFRWMHVLANTSETERADIQDGQNMLVTVYGAHIISGASVMTVQTPSIGSNLVIPAPFAVTRRGTLMQKLTDFTTGDTIIKLQARVNSGGGHPTPEDFVPQTGNFLLYPDEADGPDVKIRLRNFNFYEVITGAEA